MVSILNKMLDFVGCKLRKSMMTSMMMKWKNSAGMTIKALKENRTEST